MMINDLLSDEKTINKFGQLFFNKYIQYGFTTLSKNDLQDLILASLSEATSGSLMDNYSDYELSNFLKTTDKKIAASRMNMLQKQYFEVDREVQVEHLLKDLIKKPSKITCHEGKIEIQIENVVQKREFEAYIKLQGYQIDYKNNRQIIIITNNAFIDTLQKISNTTDKQTASILAKQINSNILKENKTEWKKKFNNKVYDLTSQLVITLIPLFLPK